MRFPNSTLDDSRRCTDFIYACTGGKKVTLWYHHFHKAGGSTFVNLAKANGATLLPRNSNGNPLSRNGVRIPFWNFSPEEQAVWARRIRKKFGTDTVVTEFGFPAPQGLLAPGPFLYVTVMREPVKRLVSNFFWRYRRFFSGQHEPRLPLGGFPDFGEFAKKQVNIYTHTLSGNAGSLGHKDLAIATVILRHFSIILVCEWLDNTAALLALHLGWAITDFKGFHEKENSALKDYGVLSSWDGDWRIKLQHMNSFDALVYEKAQGMASKQLEAAGLELPPEGTG